MDAIDIQDALASVPPADTEALERVVQGLLTQLADHRNITESEAAAFDVVQANRLLYVQSLLSLLAYLRARPDGEDVRASEQAKLSLGFIRHSEGRLLKAMQVGRSQKDEVLQGEVAKLRTELDKITEYRAKTAAKTSTS